jgi:tripartite-type tricarboxylate transporter receptor subunit TctC
VFFRKLCPILFLESIKMKLLISLVMTSFLYVANPAQARETIQMLWGFNAGSGTASNARLLAEEANRLQNKYLFVFVNKPGAGGSIAANSVASSPDNSVVSMSSSFIIRPYYEKNERTHNLNEFTPILVQATGLPLFLVSGQSKTLKSLTAKSNFTVGVSGVGSISHLVATELFKNYPGANIVNFKSMPEAALATAGKHVDAAVGQYTDVAALLEANKLSVLGYTGTIALPAFPNLLLHKQGMAGAANLTANYAVYASTNMNPNKFKEIRDILLEANRSESVINGYRANFLVPANLNVTESEVWYSLQRRYWQKQVEQATSKK